MFDPSWKSVTQAIGHGTCDGCKFWSERIAASIGCEAVKALCLNRESHSYNQMVNGGCDKHEAGIPIDMPRPRHRTP